MPGRTIPAAVPVRTCIGCRRRDARPALLRVVVLEVDGRARVVPDTHGRLPGRGAHVHPSVGCLDLADRRRAYARALRLTGAVDTVAVRDQVEAQDGEPAGRVPAAAARPHSATSIDGPQQDERPAG